MALKRNAFSTVMQTKCHYAIQGHQVLYQSKTDMQLPISQ